MPLITNLFFDAGGIKALAYTGALVELEKQNYLDGKNIIRVAGSSAGAIAAVFLAMGYKIQETEVLMKAVDFSQFIETGRYKLSYAISLFKNLGICSGNYALELFQKFLLEKTGSAHITFRQLHELREQEVKANGYSYYKDLYIVGIDLQKQETVVFSHDSPYADMPIAIAVRLSMSIPLLYTPVSVNEHFHIDGGFVDSFKCITLFDKLKYFPEWEYLPAIAEQTEYNPHTLGFRLDDSQEPAPPIEDLVSFVKCLAKTLAKSQGNKRFFKENHKRTIVCNSLDIETTEFNLTNEAKAKLFESGRIGAQQFILATQSRRALAAKQPIRRSYSEGDMTSLTLKFPMKPITPLFEQGTEESKVEAAPAETMVDTASEENVAPQPDNTAPSGCLVM